MPKKRLTPCFSDKNQGKNGRPFKELVFTYEDIAELTGLTVNNLKKKATNKEFNINSHRSVISFIAGRQLIEIAKEPD